MAKRSIRSTKRPKRSHSRRRIHRYKHTRKQHNHHTQRRQRGGVSDVPTVATVSGFPVVSEDKINKTSVSVQGFGQMTPAEYVQMAEKGELVVDN